MLNIAALESRILLFAEIGLLGFYSSDYVRYFYLRIFVWKKLFEVMTTIKLLFYLENEIKCLFKNFWFLIRLVENLLSPLMSRGESTLFIMRKGERIVLHLKCLQNFLILILSVEKVVSLLMFREGSTFSLLSRIESTFPHDLGRKYFLPVV